MSRLEELDKLKEETAELRRLLADQATTYEQEFKRRAELARIMHARELKHARELGETVGFDRGFKRARDEYHKERNEALMRLPFHPSYARWWGVILGYLLVLELTGTSRLWPWLVAAVLFFGVEAAAVIRNRPGDTFSELVWTFLWGGRARASLVLALALYLPLRLVLIPYPELVPRWLPLSVLTVGAAGWLVPHFLKQGREG